VSSVLFTLWPFTGHLLPQMAIAVALRERGHEVAFYSGESVRATIEHEGFEFHGFERVDQERAFENMRVMEGAGTRPGRSGGRLLPVLRDWLVETIPDQVADLQAVIAHRRPDVVATDLSLWGPIVVLWEAEQIPVALSSTFMGPLIPGPDAPPWGFGIAPPRTRAAHAVAAAATRATELAGRPLRTRVDEIRAGHGLGALPEPVNRFTGRLPLYLVGNVRELDYGRADLPPSVHYVGNCPYWPPAEDDATSTFLDTVPAGRPWVHVTESTLASGEPFLLRTTIAALAAEPVEVVITTGQRDPRTLGVLPPNVHVARWLNHGELLERCAAVVTVGGKATILAAAEAGVPLVVVPTTWDKPDNARRVVEAGAGLRLPARRCTPEALRTVIRNVLDEPIHREGVRRIAELLAAAPGPPAAAELLERLAAPRRAVAGVGAIDGGAT
jgi:MGT family glycosyltransferase